MCPRTVRLPEDMARSRRAAPLENSHLIDGSGKARINKPSVAVWTIEALVL